MSEIMEYKQILELVENKLKRHKHQNIIDDFSNKGFTIIQGKKYTIEDCGELLLDEVLNN